MENTSNIDVSQDSENGLSEILSLFLTSSEENSDNNEPSLLTSLKPYLNPKRQKKLEQCEKIMMLTNTFKLLNELNFFDNLTDDSKN